MQKFICDVCGYIYDPALGDPDSGIAPGTAFEDIPDDWVCPECFVSKDSFSPVRLARTHPPKRARPIGRALVPSPAVSAVRRDAACRVRAVPRRTLPRRTTPW